MLLIRLSAQLLDGNLKILLDWLFCSYWYGRDFVPVKCVLPSPKRQLKNSLHFPEINCNVVTTCCFSQFHFLNFCWYYCRYKSLSLLSVRVMNYSGNSDRILCCRIRVLANLTIDQGFIDEKLIIEAFLFKDLYLGSHFKDEIPSAVSVSSVWFHDSSYWSEIAEVRWHWIATV